MMPQKNAPQQLDARGGDASSPDPHGGETVGVRRKFEAKKGVVPARGKFEMKKAGSAEALERMFVGKVGAAEKFSAKRVVYEIRELIERIRGDDEAAAGEARDVLSKMMLSGVTGLTALAQKVGSKKEEGGSAKWACGLLACMDVWLGRHRKELGKEYEGYRRRVSGMFRWDVLAPRSPLYCALHVELWKCQFYRGEVELPGGLVELPGMGLMELPCGLAQWMRERMPEEYRPCLELPPFCAKTWKQWEGPLWGLVKANNPGLRGELAKRYKRVEGRLSRYRGETRRHLQKLARGLGG